jgi:hypothetical protein
MLLMPFIVLRAQVVTTRSSETEDMAFNNTHNLFNDDDGSDGNTIINGKPVSSSIC